MSPIDVGAPFRLARVHRQRRLGAVEGLNLGFLVDAQHHGMIARIDRDADDVADLFDQQPVVRQLEGLAQTGTQAEAMGRVVMRLIPVGPDRVLQCVTPGGVISRVVTTTRSTCLSVTVRGGPGRGLVEQPVELDLHEAGRRFPTVGGDRRGRRATVLWLFPVERWVRMLTPL